MAAQLTLAQWIRLHDKQTHSQQVAGYHAYLVQQQHPSGAPTRTFTQSEWNAAHTGETAAQNQASYNALPAAWKSTTPYSPPPVLPPNPYSAAISGLQQQQNVLPGEYNAQRQQDSALAAQNMVAGGYYDAVTGPNTVAGMNQTTSTPNTTTGTNQAGTDVVYTLQPGPDGRLYRQAFQKVAHSMQSRGVGSSFDTNYAMGQDQQALDVKRAALMQKAAQAQTTSTGKEGSQYTSIGNQIAGDIAKYQTSGTTAIGANPTSTTAPTVPTTTTTTSSNKPSFASFLSQHKGTTIKMPRLQAIYKHRYG